MTYPLLLRDLVINLATGEHQINPIQDQQIIGPVDYGWQKYHEHIHMTGDRAPELFTFGGGPLAGSRIPGTRRMVFTSYSPLWDGFYISSLGGAAYILHRVGVDFVTLAGAAPQDSVLILNHNNGDIQVRLEPINPDLIWTGYANENGDALLGFYALQQYVYDHYKNEYEDDWLRVFAVGPSARGTNQGVIGSNAIRRGEITPIDDWAGRGGLGSRLLQTHHIAACIFGGDWVDPDLQDSKEIDSYFMTYYQQTMMRTDLGATEKYRYVPDFHTGGTFGVNMHTVDDKLLSFNYSSVYASQDQRSDQHQNFIVDHYLKQFNEESIEPKKFNHCGEPCSVVCKKYTGIYKKDYEPYQALGPLCGVFDQRAAEELNHYVDAMAFDSIQMGGTISWLMELIATGVIPPQDFNLPPIENMKFQFASLPQEFDIVVDSKRNADYARAIIDMVLFDETGEIFRYGIRAAAKQLDARYNLSQPGKRSIDLAVFTAHGKEGCMTPNQYWVPGMFSPMPMMGKYFVYYGVEFVEPRELGRRCVQRMVYEFFSENTGVCRFHRKWVEAIVDDIIVAHYNLQDLNYKSHQFNICQEIYDHEGPSVVYWESQRTIDMIWKFLEDWDARGLKDPKFTEWMLRFRQDKNKAAHEFWEEMRAGIEEAFRAGPSAIPEISAPYKAAKLDIMEKK
jgi:glyceraldehyde-3-phosphate dehydrogenase (ferredoxin)